VFRIARRTTGPYLLLPLSPPIGKVPIAGPGKTLKALKTVGNLRIAIFYGPTRNE